jgi:hypothetical protein
MVASSPCRSGRKRPWQFGLKRRRDAFETPAMRLFAEFVRKVVREQPVPKRSVFR